MFWDLVHSYSSEQTDQPRDMHREVDNYRVLLAAATAATAAAATAAATAATAS